MISLYGRKVLLALRDTKACLLEEIAKKARLEVDQVRKAVEELKEKGLVVEEIKKLKKIRIGRKLIELNLKLPERSLVDFIREKGGEVDLNSVFLQSEIPSEDIRAAIGKALEKKWIEIIKQENRTVLRITEGAVEESPEEKLLNKLKLGEIDVSLLNEEDKRALERLKKRPGFVEEEEIEIRKIGITKKGLKEASKIRVIETVSSLTPQLIKSGMWKGVIFEEYDLNVKSYPIYPGRRHPLVEVIQEIREIFISLGFEETDDPFVQLAFWNFDALFQPQDHPARDMQDTFYLEYPSRGEIKERELIERIKDTHENGWITGSTGWGGRWSLDEAKKLVLRTHTTAATVKEVYRTGNKPRKVFIVGRVFRNEKMDYKHSAEFHQVDGIVIDRNANIRQLMGILTEFYKRLGLRRVKFMPSFFPYTEPSIQTSVYVEKLNDWVELAGMGIFRPEVTRPLGVEWPVLAWGCGIERIVMIRYDIDDIRLLYRGDLGWLRRRPIRRPFS